MGEKPLDYADVWDPLTVIGSSTKQRRTAFPRYRASVEAEKLRPRVGNYRSRSGGAGLLLAVRR